MNANLFFNIATMVVCAVAAELFIGLLIAARRQEGKRQDSRGGKP